MREASGEVEREMLLLDFAEDCGTGLRWIGYDFWLGHDLQEFDLEHQRLAVLDRVGRAGLWEIR